MAAWYRPWPCPSWVPSNHRLLRSLTIQSHSLRARTRCQHSAVPISPPLRVLQSRGLSGQPILQPSCTTSLRNLPNEPRNCCPTVLILLTLSILSRICPLVPFLWYCPARRTNTLASPHVALNNSRAARRLKQTFLRLHTMHTPRQAGKENDESRTCRRPHRHARIHLARGRSRNFVAHEHCLMQVLASPLRLWRDRATRGMPE